MIRVDFQRAILILGLLFCAGCAGQAAPGPGPIPSPPLGAQGAGPVSTVRPPAAGPPSATTPAPAGQPDLSQGPTSEPVGDQSVYLWPTYLPPAMRPSPGESRVARDNEVGEHGLGFFIVTLNAGDQKLVVGGGDLQDALPLAGSEQRINVGKRVGKLVTSGEQRQIIFEVPKGRLFIYSRGLSEEELLRVAESLQPINLHDLRDRAGVS